jgi:uncharacterized protein YjiK
MTKPDLCNKQPGHSLSRLLSAALLVCVPLLATSPLAEPVLTLEYVTDTKLRQVSEDLKEPSGLAISAATGELWTLSDDSSAVFRFPPDNPKAGVAIPVDEEEMEAITLVEAKGEFYTVNEDKRRIARFSMTDGQRIDRKKVQSMKGYSGIRDTVRAAGGNSGFEGLTWHPQRGHLFAVLEGPPGLLVEISADLETIVSSVALTAKRGFIDPDDAETKIDFSGVAYDAQRERLWILSDEAARVFLFDPDTGKVTQSLPLEWVSKKGKQKTVNKPEGITLSADGNQLYVVSDSEARLYQWRIHQE